MSRPNSAWTEVKHLLGCSMCPRPDRAHGSLPNTNDCHADCPEHTLAMALLRGRESSPLWEKENDTRMSRLLFVSQEMERFGIPHSFYSSLWIFLKRMNRRHGPIFCSSGSVPLWDLFEMIENRWVKQNCKGDLCKHFWMLIQVEKREITLTNTFTSAWTF